MFNLLDKVSSYRFQLGFVVSKPVDTLCFQAATACGLSFSGKLDLSDKKHYVSVPLVGVYVLLDNNGKLVDEITLENPDHLEPYDGIEGPDKGDHCIFDAASTTRSVIDAILKFCGFDANGDQIPRA